MKINSITINTKLVDDFEYNGVPPYETLRKMFKTFGMDVMAKQRFDSQIKKEEAIARGKEVEKKEKKEGDPMAAEAAAMSMIPIIELCRHAQGLVTAMGVSMGLTAGAIMSKGTIEQKKKYVPK